MLFLANSAVGHSDPDLSGEESLKLDSSVVILLQNDIDI